MKKLLKKIHQENPHLNREMIIDNMFGFNIWRNASTARIIKSLYFQPLFKRFLKERGIQDAFKIAYDISQKNMSWRFQIIEDLSPSSYMHHSFSWAVFDRYSSVDALHYAIQWDKSLQEFKKHILEYDI